jgi:glucosamine--fructose-6-phosphate aminotransferase (isomerizing)
MRASDERTRIEILDQPQSLNETIDNEISKIEALAERILKNQVKRFYLVGMGASYSAALTAKVLADRILPTPVEVYRGYELEFVNPLGLDTGSCVIPVSFSGETEDVVSALRFARSRGVFTVSVSGPEDNTIAREADVALRISSRDTKAMVAAHLSETAVLYLLFGSIADQWGSSKFSINLRKEFERIIMALPRIIADEERKGEELAKQHKNDEIFYVISAGPNYGVAYKLAMTEITENLWLHGVVQYSTEFRHGIVEKIEPGLPVIFLIGTDDSRVDIVRELETCKNLGANTIVWDAKDYPQTDPFLTPFYLEIPTQWFVYYLALERGRLPSKRRYMGTIIPYANMKNVSKAR